MSTNSRSAAVVSRILVEDLFGRYSYLIEPTGNRDAIIIYGDNGSGKTTILRLLFHLLSPARTRGHRTWVGAVPFRSIRIELSNGTTVAAHRSSASSGAYKYEIGAHQRTLSSVHIQFDEDGRIAHPHVIDEELDALLSAVEEHIGLDVYYIRDDRAVESDIIPVRDFDEPELIRWNRPRGTSTSIFRHLRASRGFDHRQDDLNLALTQATEWARRQVIGATNVGTANASSIFMEVMGRIATAHSSPDLSPPVIEQLRHKVAQLTERESELAPFGISSGFNGIELSKILNDIDADSHHLLVPILQPYLESIEARHTAVATLHARLAGFVSWINHLFKDKYVTIRMPQGIEIFTDAGQPLTPELLSSGERHLLLLLTSTLYAQEDPSLFVIDEPELSLNMKWQRQLLDALTECSRDGSTQLILATHSFEILAGHDEEVVRLIDRMPYELPLPNLTE